MIRILERLTKERINVSINTFLSEWDTTPMVKITLHRGSIMDTRSHVRCCMAIKDYIKYCHADRAFDELLLNMEKQLIAQEKRTKEELEIEENSIRRIVRYS